MGPVVLVVALGWFAGARLSFDVATLSRLAAALIPVMLLTLGMQLADNFALNFNTDLGLVVFAKLMIVPIAAFAVGSVLDLDAETLGVLVIQSSMPPAVFTAVVALEFDLEPDRVTGIVLGTTLAALRTIPVAWP